MTKKAGSGLNIDAMLNGMSAMYMGMKKGNPVMYEQAVKVFKEQAREKPGSDPEAPLYGGYPRSFFRGLLRALGETWDEPNSSASKE